MSYKCQENEKIMNKLLSYLKKPELYAESTSKFWDDEHISKGMLEAHLNPHWEAATRRHEFIDRSVEWINKAAPAEKYGKLLDLGCGPGIYGEKFAEQGYKVTGVDFSKRSIEYAKQKSAEKKLLIEYIYQNYLEIDYEEEFDLVTLIYCDFGVLSNEQRRVLLKKIYKAMRHGGKFIFDVFTPQNYEGKREENTWQLNEGSGFWKDDTHLCLESHYIYDGNTRLNQYTVIDKNGQAEVYRIWDRYYTKETITEELKEAGFGKVEVYSDVAGAPYSEESNTMCIVVKK